MQKNKIHSFISFFVIKGNAQFIFLSDRKIHQLPNSLSHENIKKPCHKKSNCVCFYNLGEENF